MLAQPAQHQALQPARQRNDRGVVPVGHPWRLERIGEHRNGAEALRHAPRQRFPRALLAGQRAEHEGVPDRRIAVHQSLRQVVPLPARKPKDAEADVILYRPSEEQHERRGQSGENRPSLAPRSVRRERQGEQDRQNPDDVEQRAGVGQRHQASACGDIEPRPARRQEALDGHGGQGEQEQLVERIEEIEDERVEGRIEKDHSQCQPP